MKLHLKSVRNILSDIGEDPNREGLLKTPARFLKSLKELTSGYNVKIDEAFDGALFEESYSGMVVVRNIEFYSLCEHHLLPFYGRCHVGYLPNKKIMGLSKIPRIVEIFSRILQIQERLTNQIGESLIKILAPQGLGVVLEVYHLCMMMRGVQKQNSFAITSYMDGEFLSQKIREAFMSHVHAKPFE